MQLSMDVCDVGTQRMREALQPGITENQLWAVLHNANIAHGGEWIECRLLTSGGRTNPWFQESSDRVIEAGDLVGYDTDMVGPTGYLADISRTLVCPCRSATDNQRRLYDLAQTQVRTNVELLQPGMTFAEFGARCWRVPDEYVPNRYMMMVHGAGMVDEYPTIAYAAGLRRRHRGEHGAVRRELHRRGRGPRRREARGTGADHRDRCSADVEDPDHRRPRRLSSQSPD